MACVAAVIEVSTEDLVAVVDTDEESICLRENEFSSLAGPRI